MSQTGVWLAGAAAVAVAAAHLAVVATPGAFAAPDSAGVGGGSVVVERVVKPARQVAGYWSRARMRRALPVTLSAPQAFSPSSRTASPAQPQGDPIVVPPAAPLGWEPEATAPATGSARRPGDGDSSTGSIPYASVELTDTTSYPNRVHGIVFFKLGKFDYSCSGTAVNSANGSVVMTAGHCVHEGGRRRHWASKLIFVPGYRVNGQRPAPFGVWSARQLFTTEGWRRTALFADDIGAATVSPNAAGETLEAVVGARGIAFNLAREQAYRSYGYPVGPQPKFDGDSLWACESQFGFVDPFPEPRGVPQSAIGCDMEGGSSGGGWVVDDAFVNSTNSFSYGFLSEVLFGPYYGDLAAQVYGRAQAG